MSEPFVGEIRMFAGNFAPRGWAFCDGQLLPITPNTALFSLLGTVYGGNGETTFGLPDMRGRLAIQFATAAGPGLSPRRLGDRGGVENVTLTNSQLPAHNHGMAASAQAADIDLPADAVLADSGMQSSYKTGNASLDAPNVAMGLATSSVGGTRSHTNLMPFLCIHYIISLVGIFPSRN